MVQAAKSTIAEALCVGAGCAPSSAFVFRCMSLSASLGLASVGGDVTWACCDFSGLLILHRDRDLRKYSSGSSGNACEGCSDKAGFAGTVVSSPVATNTQIY